MIERRRVLIRQHRRRMSDGLRARRLAHGGQSGMVLRRRGRFAGVNGHLGGLAMAASACRTVHDHRIRVVIFGILATSEWPNKPTQAKGSARAFGTRAFE